MTWEWRYVWEVANTLYAEGYTSLLFTPKRRIACCWHHGRFYVR